MKWWKIAGLTVWVIATPMGIWAAKKLNVWNFDVYTSGMATGLLLMILAGEVERYLKRIEAKLEAKTKELEAELLDSQS